jgi:hypothetical protein
MKVVWKFKMVPIDTQEIEMPVGAEILTVQAQGDSPMLWALVDPVKKKEMRKFLMLGTGHETEEKNLTYIGTFQLMVGALMFHVFETIKGKVKK